MKLNIRSDFAVRIIHSLAKTKEPKTMPILSKELFISYNHMTKIIQTLAKAGIVATRQGKLGGVYLAKDPQEISFKQVIELMEGPISLSDCVADSSFCKLINGCEIRDVFGDIQRKMNALFENVTFQDLLEKHTVKN